MKDVLQFVLQQIRFCIRFNELRRCSLWTARFDRILSRLRTEVAEKDLAPSEEIPKQFFQGFLPIGTEELELGYFLTPDGYLVDEHVTDAIEAAQQNIGTILRGRRL